MFNYPNTASRIFNSFNYHDAMGHALKEMVRHEYFNCDDIRCFFEDGSCLTFTNTGMQYRGGGQA